MHQLVVSPPWGDAVEWDCVTPTYGTYTLEACGLPLDDPIADLLYFQGVRAYRSTACTGNPGIAAARGRDFSQGILSLAASTCEDWRDLLDKAVTLRPAYVELNAAWSVDPTVTLEPYISVFRRGCSIARSLFGDAVIVKLPPVAYAKSMRDALTCGIRSFHCCGPLTLPHGHNLSGVPLMPLALAAIADLRATAAREFPAVRLQHIIGGGGIWHYGEARRYLAAGATNVAVGTGFASPRRWRSLRLLARRLQAEAGPPKPGNLSLQYSP